MRCSSPSGSSETSSTRRWLPERTRFLRRTARALRRLQADVEFAAAGAQWHGGAATAYSVANTGHENLLGKLADLDSRLASEIDNSVQVVTSGRAALGVQKFGSALTQ